MKTYRFTEDELRNLLEDTCEEAVYSSEIVRPDAIRLAVQQAMDRLWFDASRPAPQKAS